MRMIFGWETEYLCIIMPTAKQSPNYKLAWLFYGPYRIVEKHVGNVSVWPVNQPDVLPFGYLWTECMCVPNRCLMCSGQVGVMMKRWTELKKARQNDWSSHLSCHKAGTKSHYWTPKQWMEQEIGPDQGLTWLNNRLGCVQPWLGCILLRHEYREPWSHKKNQDFLNWLQPHYPWNVH